ncbi:aspartate/tyrosine/aromatic aminotransferase [Ameyamaea chiangmaiensis NBRC 103196]|uniref:pyridoxal phosphate-dependent aminotransferase n=1 Tax=Ameyamaea chiangmaiensis TaxID=442969 RepID=UPI001BAFA437|nr:pyridoxal phosphate-dependent aminotransferase [Ameyamaea chiangmaiensis]MBS4075289.1 pyridoxal phosphate-dependent aminotransferase [Ameyamaea chiangmaiensis]GBQ66664.1 aspartate/tyrosine/aromatic aminotransferase [Ameyamaea chiangmaiensis NBRC 103196]
MTGSPSTTRPSIFLPEARPGIQAIEESLIRVIAQSAVGVEDVIGLWYGEPDAVTPAFITHAAKVALDRGETFYTANDGIPPLRAAIAEYQTRLGRASVTVDRIVVTSSGTHALNMACLALLSPGDRVVVPRPCWPNLVGIPSLSGTQVTGPSLRLVDGLWRLDLQELLAALTPQTRMVILNAPGNPTGWMLSRAEQEVILAHCRQHGIWILADDVYDRLVFSGGVAPSFLDLATPQDRVIAVNSFSKSWAMTGWRLGWLTVPHGLGPVLASMNEFVMSCAPGFVQEAGIVALRDGEPFVQGIVGHYREARDYVADRLGAVPGLSVPRAEGGMYAFFRVEGCRDSLTLARNLVHRAGVGLAPGRAFGREGEGYMRLCFAVGRERLEQACARIETYLATHGPN